MILLLIVAAWIVMLALVAGLCAAARLGDLDSLTDASVADGWTGPGPLAWEPAEHLEISARANARSAYPAQPGGIAA